MFQKLSGNLCQYYLSWSLPPLISHDKTAYNDQRPLSYTGKRVFPWTDSEVHQI